MKLRNLLLITLTLLMVLPTFAQEATEAAPIVVVNAPPVESPETDSLSQFELVFASLFLLSLLFNALQAFWNKKSIPPELAMQIFSGARLLANVTPSPDDNKLVDAGERFYQDLSAVKAEERANKDAAYANEEHPRD